MEIDRNVYKKNLANYVKFLRTMYFGEIADKPDYSLFFLEEIIQYFPKTRC